MERKSLELRRRKEKLFSYHFDVLSILNMSKPLDEECFKASSLRISVKHNSARNKCQCKNWRTWILTLSMRRKNFMISHDVCDEKKTQHVYESSFLGSDLFPFTCVCLCPLVRAWSVWWENLKTWNKYKL